MRLIILPITALEDCLNKSKRLVAVKTFFSYWHRVIWVLAESNLYSSCGDDGYGGSGVVMVIPS